MIALDVTLSTGPDVQVGTGVGVTIVVAAFLAVWGSIHLRETTHKDWSDKTDLTYVGLEDRATEVLERLRNAIDDVAPPSGSDFDPSTVVADLAPVGKLAKSAVRVLKERMRIRGQFKAVMRLCTGLKWVAISFACSAIIWTLLYSFIYPWSVGWIAMAIVGSTVFTAGAVLVVIYAILRGRLQQSYEHSRPSAGGESQ